MPLSPAAALFSNCRHPPVRYDIGIQHCQVLREIGHALLRERGIFPTEPLGEEDRFLLLGEVFSQCLHNLRNAVERFVIDVIAGRIHIGKTRICAQGIGNPP